MKLSVEEFQKELVGSLQKYLSNCEIEVAEINILRCKIRVHIAASAFLNVFYAARTQKMSFAIIQKGKRVYGIDNLDSWHFHPFNNPEDHVQISEPSIEDMIVECTKVIRGLNK